MLILQIETATSVCSCALSLNGKTIVLKEIKQANVHIEKLTLLIEEALKEANYEFSDLNAVAVSKGPGSYTGLRIGVSTAKGLCFALDVPLIGVDTLSAMTSGFLQNKDFLKHDKLFCPMIDARRREVYSAVFTEDFSLLEEVGARIIDEESFVKLTEDKTLVLFGDGAVKFQETFANDKSIQVVTDFSNSAAYLSALAYEKAQKGDFEDVAYFEPFYLKDFVPTVSKKKQ